MYARFLKRPIDFLLALIAILILSPVLLLLAVIGAIVMRGNPFFTQPRPGRGERIFRLVKFRSMTMARDKDGNLLPDEQRLVGYGKFLRSTSLDELPELFNILIGQMAIVGPRPQLVRDMVFMTEAERTRHTVRPGLTGLAQINGRNTVTWEDKLTYDQQYIQRITFLGDLAILFRTVGKVFAREGINEEGQATAEDLGDYLLHSGRIDRATYDAGQREAQALLEK